MNHIFRVIFDHTRGVFIAVSELTRHQSKASKNTHSSSSTNSPKCLLCSDP
ncbi:ESPR domain-containing protein, partial [Gallibacterium genomosp. 3]|uniref:ESPR domain-containing protein n=1 Tax=Gallibacterium genomosp. 3 TaxID=505345 RepID=UPI0018D47118